jgi:hypothetical protein
MSKSSKKIETLLAQVLSQLAIEIDLNYSDKMIAKWVANEDATLVIYRQAMRELRRRELPLSSCLLHVERKIKNARREMRRIERESAS